MRRCRGIYGGAPPTGLGEPIVTRRKWEPGEFTKVTGYLQRMERESAGFIDTQAMMLHLFRTLKLNGVSPLERLVRFLLLVSGTRLARQIAAVRNPAWVTKTEEGAFAALTNRRFQSGEQVSAGCRHPCQPPEVGCSLCGLRAST